MIWKARILWAWVLLIALSRMAAATDCAPVTYFNISYTVCTVDARTETIRVFLRDPVSDALYGTFTTVDGMLSDQGKGLRMAMNAGMYHADREPVGLFIEGQRERTPLISRAGPGNFGMLPNGVFCVRDGRADVFETRDYMAQNPLCHEATQSGPMLVIDGELHPRFLPDSDSRYIRNGVGTSENGKTVYFAISEMPVTFYEFGSLFRDHLGTPNALYFDGNVSRLFDSANGRNDLGFPVGPIVGVVEDRAAD